MYTLENKTFITKFNECGNLVDLKFKSDKDKMNWVISEDYLTEHSYDELDKLFGSFELAIDGVGAKSSDIKPKVNVFNNSIEVVYIFENFTICQVYFLKNNDEMEWTIKVINNCISDLELDYFNIWFPLSYIMYRDENVHRNMNHSCAVFSHISHDFSKIAAIKRSNQAPHLGIYNTRENTKSLGTYCRYQNLFEEKTSPSLDGALFHQFVLVKNEEEVSKHDDWIYKEIENNRTIVKNNSHKTWSYIFCPILDENDFQKRGKFYYFPVINYKPVVQKGEVFEASIKANRMDSIKEVWLKSEFKVTKLFSNYSNDEVKEFDIKEQLNFCGEYKLIIEFVSNKKDFIVFSVMPTFREILKERVKYLNRESWGSDNKHPYAYGPVSNQGESLGKLNFLMAMALLNNNNDKTVQRVEESIINYVAPKWFYNGDFNHPIKLYGNFYRIMDFDYIAHTYYLLSKANYNILMLNTPVYYLECSANILINRFSIEKHDCEREKVETNLPGVFVLFINDLLLDLKKNNMYEKYIVLENLWQRFNKQLISSSKEYRAAITEHYFDNAGFGPACSALCLSNNYKAASRYAELIKANCGFSNDFRKQNPDRWWESLAYMIHSLWGGLVSYSALLAYEHLEDKDLLLASYRTMLPIFYCYDWTANTSNRKLLKGEAASTYCVANPNINMKSLSNNRFGQSVFAKNEGVLSENATGDDWDMGEELVAYLKGFGIKTYLIYESEKIKCVNGYIEKLKNGDLLIKSYAAFPKEYYFYEEKISFKCEGHEIQKQVILTHNEKNEYVFITC